MHDLERSRSLLAEVFPHDTKFQNDSFLEWQYLNGPSGKVIASESGDEVGLLGHYAVLPQRWIRGGSLEPWALSLNTAVSERARGRGLFTKLAAQTYESAAADGTTVIVGVANANSTPGFVGRLEFDLVGPLDVAVLPWRPSIRPGKLRRTTLAEIAGDGLLDRVNDLGVPATRRYWDIDELRWRLSGPGAQFTVLRTDEAAVIGCRTAFRGVPVAVIAKVLVEPSAGVIDLGPIARATCVALRAPLALYAGRNNLLRVRGARLPDRLRPSPLNLIIKSLQQGVPSSSFMPTVFEFLDFDAY